MLMTPIQARDIWCPDSRVRGTSSSYNRDFESGSSEPNLRRSQFCVSTKCAAWRWYSGTYGYCGRGGVITKPYNMSGDVVRD